MSEHPACHVCGKPAAMRFKINRAHGGGKARVRHNCPHGLPCEAGDRLNGMHANNPRVGGCRECWKFHKPPYAAQAEGGSK